MMTNNRYISAKTADIKYLHLFSSRLTDSFETIHMIDGRLNRKMSIRIILF